MEKLLVIALLLLALAANAQIPGPTNDTPSHQIRFSTPAEADAARTALITAIFNSPTLPTTLPTVTLDIPDDPVQLGATQDLQKWDQVWNGVSFDPPGSFDTSIYSSLDHLEAFIPSWDLDPGRPCEAGICNDYWMNALILNPVVTNANTADLVIVAPGHQGFSNHWGSGINTTVEILLEHGYTVAIICMQGTCSNHPAYNGGGTIDDVDGCGSVTFTHGTNMTDFAGCGTHWGFRVYLEVYVQTINYWESLPGTGDVHGIGISGGAGILQMAAAVDPRLRVTVPVSGSAPLYHRNASGGAAGDIEQNYTPMFDEDITRIGAAAPYTWSGGGLATWLEIYALGGYGAADRLQVQVTNAEESNFGGDFPESYRGHIVQITNRLNLGSWFHVYQRSANPPKHAINPETVHFTLLRAIKANVANYCAGVSCTSDYFGRHGREVWAEPQTIGAIGGIFADGAFHIIDDAAFTWGIEVRDGGSGEPTTVRVLDTGAIDALVTVSDESFLDLRGGDFAGTVEANDDARIEISGGSFSGLLVVRDDAEILVIGFDLAISNGKLTGRLADGTDLGAGIDVLSEGNGTFVLDSEPLPVVPVPGIALGAVAALLLAAFSVLRQPRTRRR